MIKAIRTVGGQTYTVGRNGVKEIKKAVGGNFFDPKVVYKVIFTNGNVITVEEISQILEG